MVLVAGSPGANVLGLGRVFVGVCVGESDGQDGAEVGTAVTLVPPHMSATAFRSVTLIWQRVSLLHLSYTRKLPGPMPQTTPAIAVPAHRWQR
jgi:hypothetical protein